MVSISNNVQVHKAISKILLVLLVFLLLFFNYERLKVIDSKETNSKNNRKGIEEIEKQTLCQKVPMNDKIVLYKMYPQNIA